MWVADLKSRAGVPDLGRIQPGELHEAALKILPVSERKRPSHSVSQSPSKPRVSDLGPSGSLLPPFAVTRNLPVFQCLSQDTAKTHAPSRPALNAVFIPLHTTDCGATFDLDMSA